MGARGDWATHNLEHAVSAVYDIPHGGGLAILFPHWLRFAMSERLDRHVQLAVRVFGVNPEGKTDEDIAKEGIDKLAQFWSSIGAPSRLADYDIDDSRIEEMADIATTFGDYGNFKKLNKELTVQILTAAL